MNCDHCRKGPGNVSPRLDLESLRKRLSRGDVDAWWADYSTVEGRVEACDRLNRLLTRQRSELAVTVESLESFLQQAAPVVAVDGQVLSIIVLPTAAQLDIVLSGSA